MFDVDTVAYPSSGSIHWLLSIFFHKSFPTAKIISKAHKQRGKQIDGDSESREQGLQAGIRNTVDKRDQCVD